MTSGGLSYASYLRLPELLGAQRPVTPPQERPTWAAERFFIVCHQTSELWLSQVLVDLADAAGHVGDDDWPAASAALIRAGSMVLLLSRNLIQLIHLPREEFLRFRTELHGASGAESEQFVELLRGRRHPHVQAVGAGVAAALARMDLSAPHHPGSCVHDECAVSWAHKVFIEGVMMWRGLHARITRHFIGDLPGTGGTSGVDYLLRRLFDDEGADRHGPQRARG